MDAKVKIDIKQVKPGMIWYEDNTFLFERLPDKKIKAVVELVEKGVIYGDLTASELFDISEEHLSWFDAENYFKKFHYPCEENEEVVWYDLEQLKKVYVTYYRVIKTLNMVDKMFRTLGYWSFTEYYDPFAWYWNFSTGLKGFRNKFYEYHIRPVLALKVE